MEAQVTWVYERSKTCETKNNRANEVNLGCCWSEFISVVALRGRQERRESSAGTTEKDL